ncbi:hypothetical protein [Schwartzia sp. (in: firmicutes)]
MKKLKSLKIFFLTALFVMSLCSVAFAGAQGFRLVNNTGFPIHQVHVSASTTNNWEGNAIGGIILKNGQSVQIMLGENNQQYWDIQAVFEDGSSLAWYNIDIFSTSQVTLNNNGTATLE